MNITIVEKCIFAIEINTKQKQAKVIKKM